MFRAAKLLCAVLLASASAAHAGLAPDLRAQVVIYGCTPAGPGSIRGSSPLSGFPGTI